MPSRHYLFSSIKLRSISCPAAPHAAALIFAALHSLFLCSGIALQQLLLASEASAQTDPTINSLPRVAVVVHEKNQGQIYLIDPSTKELSRLTTQGGSERMPSWSPDGTKLALVSDVTGVNKVFVYDDFKKKLWKLSDGRFQERNPNWSPDSKRIAFESGAAAKQDLFISDFDSKNLVTLGKSANFDSSPRWSPQKDRILFLSNRSRSSAFLRAAVGLEVFRIDADGGNTTRISKRSICRISNPEEARLSTLPNSPWSSDGKLLLYSSGSCNIDCATCMLHLTTKVWTRIGDKEHRVIDAAWSPDDSKIAYVDQVNLEVYIYDVATKISKKLIKNSTTPQWYSDHEILVMQNSDPYQQRGTNLVLVDINSGTKTPLTSFGADDKRFISDYAIRTSNIIVPEPEPIDKESSEDAPTQTQPSSPYATGPNGEILDVPF